MNNNGILHFCDKDFSALQAEDCELLFRISTGRLSYAIIDKQKSNLKALFDTVLLHPLADTIRELFIAHPYLDYHFQQVKIAAETFNFIFIPSELFSKENLPVYQNFVTSTLPVTFAANEIHETGLTTVASVGETQISALSGKYPGAKIFSQADALIKGGHKYYSEGSTLILQFNTGTFEALLLSGSEIIFYNIFSAPTADDFNYFLLLIIRQLGLEESDTSVILSGETEKYNGNFRRASKYFSNIQFADSTRLFSYPEALSPVPVHQFFSLLSLSLCE